MIKSMMLAAALLASGPALAGTTAYPRAQVLADQVVANNLGMIDAGSVRPKWQAMRGDVTGRG